MDRIKTTSYNIIDALYELNAPVMQAIKTEIKNNEIEDMNDFLNSIENNSGKCVLSKFLKIEFETIKYSTMCLMIESVLWCKRNNYRW